MRLWVQRSVTADWWGRKLYRLTLAVEVDAVEQKLIASHDLAVVEVWASPVALAMDAEAERSFAQAAVAGGWHFGDSARQIGLLRAGLRAAAEGMGEARVTVGDLMAGVALEAGEARELTLAEQGVRDGFEAIETRLEALIGFEDGAVSVFDWPQPEDAGTPAVGWFGARLRR